MTGWSRSYRGCLEGLDVGCIEFTVIDLRGDVKDAKMSLVGWGLLRCCLEVAGDVNVEMPLYACGMSRKFAAYIYSI